ncbi:MAG: hypothetical protein EBR82_53690 [Caulobacteraceae bacterium]|nr:hypothetical protein [Caulobacteraceae bacterium]
MIFRGLTIHDGHQPSYFCAGSMYRPTLAEIIKRGIGELMAKKKTKKETTIKNVSFSPLMKQSISRQLMAWAKSKSLEKVQVER